MPTTEQACAADRPKSDIKKQKIKKEKHDSSVTHSETKVSDPGGRLSPSEHSFIPEIQNMMFGFGDFQRPLIESAQLVEEIVHQQLNSILLQATDYAIMRGSKVIGPEDILFLFRKDKNKLCRLLRYLEVKDSKGYYKIQVDESEEVAENAGFSLEQSSLGAIDRSSALYQNRRNKSLRVCYKFLSQIDQTGELVSLLGDSGLHDEVKHSRDMRADHYSRCLNPAQYLEFSEARGTSFARKFRATKFKDWLLKDSVTDLKPSALALELFHYIAFETVAQIVDLALLVKNDAARAGDEVAQGMTSQILNPDYPSVHLSSVPTQKASLCSPTTLTCATPTSPSQGSLSPCSPSSLGGSSSSTGLSLHSPPGKARPKKRPKIQADPKGGLSPSYRRIQPYEIREAIHRFWRPSGPFFFFTCLPDRTIGSRLLSC